MNNLIKTISATDIFVDTSAWYAVIYSDDNDHKIMLEKYKMLLENGNNMITTNLVKGETFTLMRFRLPLTSSKPFDFLKIVNDSPRIKEVSIVDINEDKLISLLKKYSNHKLSYVDASSFVLMNTLNIEYALTLDNHFTSAGFIAL